MMKELSLPEHQHICTFNTTGYIAHTSRMLGESSTLKLFDGLLDAEGKVLKRTHLGRPISTSYFREPDNWFDNELSLRFFTNAEALGLDLIETGKATVSSNLVNKNGVVLALVQVLGPNKVFEGANRVNSLYNRTKDVKVSELTASGGVLTLNYRFGFTHNELVTRHNVGAYTAVLEYLGYRDVGARIVTDRVATADLNGLTEIEFSWRPKSLAERTQFFLASFVSKKLLSPYLQSSRYLHDFHYGLINDYQYQLTKKNQVLKELEVRYLSDISAKNAIIEKQVEILKQSDSKMNKRDKALNEQLEHWLANCSLEQLQSVTEAATALHLTEKTLSRKVQVFYQTTPKRLLRDRLIKRSSQLLKEEPVESVALHCGYANTSSYARAFKAVMGHSPSETLERNSSAEPDWCSEKQSLSENDLRKSENGWTVDNWHVRFW